MGKSLLLISSRPDDAAFAQIVAQTAEMTLRKTASAEEGASIIASEEISAILVDVSSEATYKALEGQIQEKVGLFSDKVNANAFHFLTSEPLEKIEYLIQSPVFGHYVLRNSHDVRAAGELYGRLIKSTLDPRAFGLEKILKAGTKIQVVKLQTSSQKQDAVEAVKNYLIACKFQSRMATVVANAVDELVMNSIFDAPVDEVGKQKYAQTPRSTELKLEGQDQVEMHVGFDGTYVAVTAVDNYGSIDKAKLLKHISKIYTDEEYKVRSAVAGAGIGLATVFRSGGSFFFASESRTRTEVTVFFKRTDNFKEFKDQFRFISTQFYF